MVTILQKLLLHIPYYYYVVMYTEIVSVPAAIREVLAGNYVYMQALQSGIANYTSLAEKIKPDIEKLIGSKVNLNTVVVAIKRFSDALEEKPKVKSTSVTPRPKMSLTGSIIDVNFHKEHDDELADFLDEFFEQESRFNLFQTDNHFTLLTEDAQEIRNIVTSASEKFDGKIKEGLSRITISPSSDERDAYLLLSEVSSILYSHQIPLHSAFFTPDEIVLILSEKHAAKAYDLIRLKIA